MRRGRQKVANSLSEGAQQARRRVEYGFAVQYSAIAVCATLTWISFVIYPRIIPLDQPHWFALVAIGMILNSSISALVYVRFNQNLYDALMVFIFKRSATGGKTARRIGKLYTLAVVGRRLSLQSSIHSPRRAVNRLHHHCCCCNIVHFVATSMMPQVGSNTSPPSRLPKNPYNNKVVLGSLVLKVFNDAKKDKRVVHGLQKCSQVLEKNPDDTLVCLIASEHDPDLDPTVNMFLLLIAAFCNENCIPLIKVIGLERLLTSGKEHSHRRRANFASPGDFACVLIKMPTVSTMSADEAKLITLLRVVEDSNCFVPQAELPG
uniref:Ribosomal protein L7Ae/L30e/S12e/Gadd45 domain-containing protein n=1 Tax=Plectus sambesii TaxID=2011161 RepID=A0A914VKX1_9BILA